MAVGTDVGGSVRLPAFQSGVYGFKISSYRISNLGHSTGRKSRFGAANDIVSITGPIGSSVYDLK